VTLKEWLIFAYGLVFATSTPYLKPKKRFLFPTATRAFDESLTFFLGGSGICARLGSLVVNANIEAAAVEWRGIAAGASDLVLSSVSGAFGGADEVRALGVSRVFAHVDAKDDSKVDAKRAAPSRRGVIGFDFVAVDSETVLSVGDETVRLIPVRGCATEADLVVFFEKRSVMMFGSLFVNRIHPVLQMGVAARVPSWISTLEELLARFSPAVCIPGEGEFGGADDVREFIRYLRSLTDPAIEFSFCRQNFDWMEIPRSTSLEENFDLLRHGAKTHASIR
jgi:hypothetical protein